jgi:hypothetical protein
MAVEGTENFEVTPTDLVTNKIFTRQMVGEEKK